MVKQKKNSISSAVVSNTAKKWTHIDPSKSSERKKKKKSTATFVRRCLGDAVANGEHKRWRRKQNRQSPKRLFCESTIPSRFDSDTGTSPILFFFSEKENCDLSVNSLATLTTTTRKKTNLCSWLRHWKSLLHTSYMFHWLVRIHTHTLKCGANISALIATGDSWLFKLSTGAGDTLFVQVISHASFNTVQCQ